jgi:hypothetical protein
MRFVAIVLLGTAATASAQLPGCPDSSDPASLVDVMVDKAFGAYRGNAGALPPSCLPERLSASPYLHTDSAVVQSLALADALLKRNPDDGPLLAARVILLDRMRRYKEIDAAVSDVFGASPALVTYDLERIAVGAAFRTADTANIRKHLSIGAGRFGKDRPFGAELAIFEQLPRLRALPDTVRRRMRADKTLTLGYANLVSIYGNLDMPDSALAYTRVALKNGVERSVVAKSLESLIGTALRHAQFMSAPDVWEKTLPRAEKIDSTLSTQASKYLLALTLSRILEDETRTAGEILSGGNFTSPAGLTRKRLTDDQQSFVKVMTCPKLQQNAGEIGRAGRLLDAGGAKFDTVGARSIRAALSQMRGVMTMLQPYC